MKYKLIKKSTKHYGTKLYLIRALKSFGDVKKGDLGGYIEKEGNLSQEGNAWVYDDAKVFDNAKIFGNAQIYSNVKVYRDAQVYDNALVSGNAVIDKQNKIFNVDYTPYNITVTPQNIQIGCLNHTQRMEKEIPKNR